MDDFKKELKALLDKYKAEIGFDCDECSDLHGVTGEHMYVRVGDREEKFDTWSLEGFDLKG